jgi:UDP-glucose 4-epimerase
VAVRKIWSSFEHITVRPIYQYRRDGIGDGFVWEPLQTELPVLKLVEKTGHIDVMIILAGVVPANGVDFELNSRLTESCLTTAYKIGTQRVIVASSSAVYGNWSKEPYSETDYLKPITRYGESKMKMEQVCRDWQEKGINVCCMRIGNFAGADALLSHLAGDNTSDQFEIDQFENGKGPLRSYIGPKRFSLLLSKLCTRESTLPFAVNVASYPPQHMEDLATSAKMNWKWRQALVGAHQNITLDCDLINIISDIKTKDVSAEDIIGDMNYVRSLK